MLFVILCVLFGRNLCDIVCDPVPGTPVNDPFGTEFGINPGRVVWSYNQDCCSWDGYLDNYFWESQNTNQTIVDEMFEKMILALVDSSTTLENAWDEIFKYYNKKRNGTSEGYLSGEKIAIKINLNNQMMSYKDNNNNELTPQYLKTLLSHLVNIVGVAQEDITVYDASRLINEFFVNPPQGIGEEFPNVNLHDNKGGKSWVVQVQPDENSFLQFSNKTVPHYDETKIPQCVTDAKYLFTVDNFRAHDLAGITATAKNFFGSIYRKDSSCWLFKAGHWCPAQLHDFIIVENNPMGSYSPLVDLLGYDEFGQKCVLYLVDGLYGGESENIGMAPIRWASLDNHWSSSMFVSQDPVALDSVLFDFLRNEPNIPFARTGCVDNYLHESAMAGNPPSKTVYNPTGLKQLSSLGCHEHWNNENDKQYSRNLGKDNGIELVRV